MKIIKITHQCSHLKEALKATGIDFLDSNLPERLESVHQRKGLFKYLVTESNDILYVTDAFTGSRSQEVHKFALTPQIKEHCLSAVCCFSPDMDKLYITEYNRDYDKVKNNCAIFTNDSI